MDERWKRLGKLLVEYSVGVRPRERVMIAMGEVETFPLLCGVYEACVRARAYPQVQFLSETLNRILLKYGDPEQIDWVPEIEAYGMEWADVYIGLRGAYNLNAFWDIPGEQLSRFRKTLGKVSRLRWQKTRWCLVRVPNALMAQQAGVDEETYLEMFFQACFLDWPSLSQRWQEWARVFSRGRTIRVVGRDTDLRFSLEGRKWLVCDGKINMPDGEIMTAPVETSVEGYIFFEFPGVLGGRLVQDVFLRWKGGELVEARASTNADYLRALLETDEGASRIGEFAFGVNPAIVHFSKDILFDEKMWGTVHIALGRAYPEAGGVNDSAIHWDLIKDLREEGEVYLDGELIFQKGKMLL